MHQQLYICLANSSTLISVLLLPLVAIAQVPESGPNSLGTFINPGFSGSTLELQVTGGKLSNDGRNLFHGFGTFSPNMLPVRFFDLGAENIFVRVTGGPSLIEQELAVDGGANLFLLNPNGVTFGTGARLDLDGDFFATTATSIAFSSGNFDMATNMADVMLLVGVPTGLQLGASPILVAQGAQLVTQPGSTLSLLGAGIEFTEGAEVLSNLGRINLVSATNSELPLSPDLSLDCSSIGCPSISANDYRDISLSNASGVRVLAGDLTALGRNITLTGGSRLVTRPDDGEAGGTLFVLAQDTLSLSGVNLNNESGLFAENLSASEASPGTIGIRAGDLSIQDGARITTSTNGVGDGGRIEVIAPKILIDGTSAADGDPSGIFSESFLDATGAGGPIELTTNQLTVSDGGTISSQTSSPEDGGDITIRSDQLILIDRASITVSTNGLGDAGMISITADEQVQISGDDSGIFSASLSSISGQGGLIDIDTEALIVEGDGVISSATSSSEPGGTIDIDVDQLTVQSAGSIVASTDGVGEGGAIDIDTDQLTLQNEGRLSVSAEGASRAGNISVNATNVELTAQGQISATTASGFGGNLDFTVSEDIILRFNSEIVAEAQGSGDGGSITFDVGGFILGILSENSDVVAGSESGQGGRITGNAKGIFTFRQFDGVRTSLSDFTAASGSGLDGTVDIQTPEPPDQEPLGDDLAGNDIARGCNADNPDGIAQSRFVIVNLGGLATQPSNAGSNDHLLIDPVDPISSPQSNDTLAPYPVSDALAVLELPCHALVE